MRDWRKILHEASDELAMLLYCSTRRSAIQRLAEVIERQLLEVRHALIAIQQEDQVDRQFDVDAEMSADRKKLWKLPIEHLHKLCLQRALEETNWNITQTAKMMGRNIKTIYNWIQRFELERPPGTPTEQHSVSAKKQWEKLRQDGEKHENFG